ncbi:OapC/ArvC family zinc-ribbon domain-containing protein [Haladaptatus sp. NG-SE-30]
MPHKCTNCGRTFADGSKEMLSGCPECGGNKFQFQPAGVSPDETKASTATGASANAASNPESESTHDSDSSSGAVGRAASTVRDWVGSRDDSKTTKEDTTRPSRADRAQSSESEGTQAADAEQTTEADSSTVESDVEPGEDRAQASARSDVVTDDELPEPPADEEGTVVEPQGDAQPSLEELREELNSQFESIKVVEPGQYELNLMELYERDEYIIALKENGRYVIQVSDSWSKSANQ